MLSALQQLYRAIINAPTAAPSDANRPSDDRLQLHAPLTVTTDSSGRVTFRADARTQTCLVRHRGAIRPCQLHLSSLHGSAETFSIRLLDRLGGCVQLAAHFVDQRSTNIGKRTTLAMSFQGLTDHLDDQHPQLSHSGSMSGRLELRGRTDDPASWTCRIVADYHAAPRTDAAPQDIRHSQPQHAA